jgi:hypothetical protein
VPTDRAAQRIALLAEQMMRLGKSGYTIKEASPAIQHGSPESLMESRFENR